MKIGIYRRKFLLSSLSMSMLIISIVCSTPNFKAFGQEEDSLNCKDNLGQQGASTPIGIVLPGFHYIKKFDKDGNPIAAWGTKGSGDGQFLHAHGIAVDHQDNVYVSDAELMQYSKI